MAEPRQTINDPAPCPPSTNPDAQAAQAVAAIEKFLGINPAPEPTTEDLNSPPKPDTTAPAIEVPCFEIIGLIGRGGMGDVYRARDLVIQRDVAVKVLQDKYPIDSPAAGRFMEEARITGQLQHPGIPAVYQIGKLLNGRPFLAMKLIKGETLEDLLKKPAGEHPNWLAIFESICQAVGYAHARNVIHRDLKPANIMVGGFGEVQVMDWGLAKVLPASRDQAGSDRASREHERPEQAATEIRTLRDNDTRDGSIIGTAAYMSPEQAGGEIDRIDQRSDVFSLGAILCTILTGQPPYAAKDFESVLRMAIRCKTEEAFQRLDACGAESDLIFLAKCSIHEEPAHRPNNANEVAEAINSIRTDAEERARDAELERQRAEVYAGEQWKRRKVQFALLLALMLGATLSIFYAVRAERNAEAATEKERQSRLFADRADYFARQADKEAAAAKRQTELAYQYANEAKAHAKRADYQALEATKNSNLANDSENKLADQLRESRRLLDLTRMRIAQTDFANNQTQLARDTLNDVAPVNRCTGWQLLNREFDGGLFALYGHTAAVNGVAMSSDGSRIVTGSWDKTARLWDARSGRLIREFKGHTNGVNSVALSTEGRHLATGSTDRTARLWDLETGEHIPFTGHIESVQCVALSADGKFIATGSTDRTARLWDATNGRMLVEFSGHKDTVRSVALSPDGSRLMTGSQDNTARLWDARTGEMLVEFKGHTSCVQNAVFSGDTKQVATGSWDNTARLWDTRTGETLKVFKGHDNEVLSVALTSDGSRLITASADHTARLWDTRSGQTLLEFKGHTRAVTNVAVSPDGSRLVTCSADASARVWSLRSRHQVCEVKGGRLIAATMSPEREVAATLVEDGVPQLWSVRTGHPQPLSFQENARDVELMALSADGNWLAAATSDDSQYVWDISTGSATVAWKGAKPATCLALSSDGRLLITGTLNRTAVLRNLRTGKSLEFTGHTGTVFAVDLSADSKWLVTGSSDRTACLWEASSGQNLLKFEGHSGTITSLALSADASRLVTGSHDKTARLWDARSGQPLGEFKGHSRSVLSVALSRDGNRLATGSEDGSVRLWDVRTGLALLELKAHGDSVIRVFLSVDGTKLFSFAADGSFRLWDARPLFEGIDLDISERQMRLWKTRPDPDWHVEQRKKFESEKNGYAAALHRSFEQHARGVVAVDYSQFDNAYWHFVAAALLKPPDPKAVEIEPKK